MKQFVRTLFAAGIAAMAFVSCAQNELTPDVVEGKKVTVHFGTENTDPTSTKATLTPIDGETAFQAAWEVNDEISISYSFNYADPSITTGKWIGSSFEATISGEKGDWMYEAAYPVPDAKDSHVDFGSTRTQKGNAYNSKYDIMIGTAAAENAYAGKDEAGKDIVFKMDRQTAIAYFHFTSDLDEAVTKATLTVAGKGAFIASNYAYVSGYAWSATEDCTSITLTFPEEAPSAKDFQLWFNVLPTIYDSMSLTVETTSKTFTISKNTGESCMYEAGKLYKVKKSGISWTDKGGSTTPSTVTDVITADKLAATGTSYTDFSGVQISSNAVYAGNNAKSTAGAIQLRSSNSDSGIVTTTSGGKATKVSVEWASSTTNGRVINVYGNTNPYTAASDLYATDANSNQGTKIGTIVYGTSTELIIDGDYPYIGIRSNSGALYLGSVSITWESGSSEPAPDTYSVSCATVTGGTLSASPVKAKAGAEVTLTATPAEGYAFNNDWTVKDADETAITVTVDGKFNMPAKNVTVSGSFSKADYTITKATCEGGSFTVKKDGEEVTKAQVGDAITLEASAAPGYEFDSWTVTNELTSKTVYVSENSFTMPGANVTVSANFLRADEIPVYASVADLIKVGAPTSEGAYVTVTLTNEEITKFYTTSAKARRGVYFTVGTQEIELFGDIACPEEWVAGGWVSGTLTKCKWMEYKGTWELCPTDWTELTYAAPCETPVITLDGASATIECATGEATIRYTTDGTDPVETSAVYTAAVPLEDGQTIKAKAFLDGHKPSDIASKKYTAGSKKVEKTATITFGTNNVKIDSKSVSANDNCKNSWTITTDITSESFTQQPTYSQVGASKKPATSITFTTTLPLDAEVSSIEGKFGGFSGTAGDVSLKVGDTEIGSGALSGTTDVTVTSTNTADGNVVTVSITGISKGVKCYYIKVVYKTAE